MDPIRLLQLEVRGFLLLLTAILAYRLLTRRIALAGLLARKDDGGRISPERVQLLLATLGLSAKYLSEVLQGGTAAMPDVSADWLIVFGGSSGIYAALKALTTLRKK
jgi:hypothetical protein